RLLLLRGAAPLQEDAVERLGQLDRDLAAPGPGLLLDPGQRLSMRPDVAQQVHRGGVGDHVLLEGHADLAFGQHQAVQGVFVIEPGDEVGRLEGGGDLRVRVEVLTEGRVLLLHRRKYLRLHRSAHLPRRRCQEDPARTSPHPPRTIARRYPCEFEPVNRLQELSSSTGASRTHCHSERSTRASVGPSASPRSARIAAPFCSKARAASRSTASSTTRWRLRSSPSCSSKRRARTKPASESARATRSESYQEAQPFAVSRGREMSTT